MLFTKDILLWLGKTGIQKIYLGDILLYERKSSWFTLTLDTTSN